MSDKYNVIQQRQPLRVPDGWTGTEKAFVIQLDEIFDDIYRRYGRLRLQDMEQGFRNQIADDEENIAELTLDVSGLTTRVGTAEGNISDLTLDVGGLTTRVGTAEGDIGSLGLRCDGFDVSIGNKYDKISGISIDSNGIEVSGSKYVKIQSGGTFDVDATDFQIKSANKSIKIGDWTLDQNGLTDEIPDSTYGKRFIFFGENGGAGNGYPCVAYYADINSGHPYSIIELREANHDYSRLEIQPTSVGLRMYSLSSANPTGEDIFIDKLGFITRWESEDLDNCISAGSYHYTTSALNQPYGATYHGTMFVEVKDQDAVSTAYRYVYQTIYDDKAIYMRRREHPTIWSSWYKFIAMPVNGGFTYGQLSGR